MKKSELKKLMEKYSIEEFEYEDVCDFVSDLLEKIAKELEENEPYATTTIKNYKKASYEAFNLVCYIEEILEGEDEWEH